MERKKGFIDLGTELVVPDAVRSNTVSGLEFKDLPYEIKKNYIDNLHTYFTKRSDVSVTKIVDIDSLIFKFAHKDGNTYYFNYDQDCTPYGELIYAFLCEDLGIPHIDYDIAKIGALEGTISQDYNNESVTYITGEQLLRENGNLEIEFSPIDTELAKIYGIESVIYEKTKYFHSLEEIWYSLENRYKNRPALVEKLMNEIINMFILDLLTGQTDRHSDNWGIIEDSNDIRVHPIFDSRRIFSHLPYISEIALSVNSHSENDEIAFKLEDNILDFIRQSSREFVDRFKNSLWVLSPENFANIVERIEAKTGAPFPEKLKYEFAEKFETQLEFLLEVLEIDQVEPNSHSLK